MHRCADADGSAVDRADYRLFAIEDPQRQPPAAIAHAFVGVIDRAVFADWRAMDQPIRALAVIEGILASAKISTRTEGAVARTRDDHRADAIVSVGHIKRGDHL